MGQKISQMNPVVAPALTDKLEDAQIGATESLSITLAQIKALLAPVFHAGDPNSGEVPGKAGDFLYDTDAQLLYFCTQDGVENWNSNPFLALFALANLSDVAVRAESAANINLAYAASSTAINILLGGTLRTVTVDTSAAGVTVSVPFAADSSNNGRYYQLIKPSAAHDITLSTTNPGELFNDLANAPNANYTITGKGFVELTSNGVNTWYVKFTEII